MITWIFYCVLIFMISLLYQIWKYNFPWIFPNSWPSLMSFSQNSLWLTYLYNVYFDSVCFLKLQKYFALFLLHLFFLQIFCSLSVPVNHSFVYSARSFIVSWVDFVITRWWRRCIILFLLWKQNWIILWHPVATNWIYTKFQMNSILHSPLHASPPVIHEICHSLPHFVIVYCRPTLIKQSRSSRALGRGQAKYCLFSQALPYFFFGILYLREASNDLTLSTRG